MSEWKTYKSQNHDLPDLLDYQDLKTKKSSQSFNHNNQVQTNE
jgi:hypothetical protein